MKCPSLRSLSLLALLCLLAPVPARAQFPGGNWQLLWADEFTGTSLDPVKWNTNYPWGPTHNHEAYMSPDHVTVDNGILSLTATRGTPPGAPATTTSGGVTYNLNYTSGAVNTSGLLNLTYGYVEARLKMPQTVGTWPAFWMLQDGWPPEIDIQETPFPNYDAMWRYWVTYHYGSSWQDAHSYGSGSWYTGADLTAGYHNYGVDWEPDHMTFYFDGRSVYTVWDTSAIAQSASMYLILNLAVGGWPGSPPDWAGFPTSYTADWVRVWQHPPGSNMRFDWKKTGNGNQNWDDASAWTNGIPMLGSQEAWFGNPGAGTTDVRLDWAHNKTVGALTFDSAVNYTVGWPDDSLMMASDSGRAWIRNLGTAGQGRLTLASRIETYNPTSILNNTPNPIVLNANVIGQSEISFEGGKATINSTSTLSQSGGTFATKGGDITLYGTIDTPADEVTLSRDAGTTGTLRIMPSATINADTIRVGGYNGGTGYFQQLGGTVNVGQWFAIGQSGNATGTVDLNGGTVNMRTSPAGGDMEIGVFDHSSGTLNISASARINFLNNAALVLGSRNTTGNGTVNQNGGTLAFYADAGATPGGSGGLVFGRPGGGATGIYAYNLNAGTLTTPSISHSAGTALFYFNGGTLAPATDSTTFMQGLTAAYIKPAGAIIDTASHDITIAQPLLAAGGGLTKRGAGTLTLSGLNAYSGATTISQGTLRLTDGAGFRTGNVIVNNAIFETDLAGLTLATLDGTGTTIVGDGIHPARLAAARIRQNALTIAGNAVAAISPSPAGSPAISTLSNLTLQDTGRLDLGNNSLLLTGAPPVAYDTYAPLLRTGAIYTSQPQAGSFDAALALVDNADLHLASWHGTPVSSSSSFNQLLFVYTYAGDANLDGLVSPADYANIIANMGLAGAAWFDGDLNGDGSVTRADYDIVTRQLGAGTGGALGAPLAAIYGPTPVPEPASLTLLLLTSAALLRRP